MKKHHVVVGMVLALSLFFLGMTDVHAEEFLYKKCVYNNGNITTVCPSFGSAKCIVTNNGETKLRTQFYESGLSASDTTCPAYAAVKWHLLDGDKINFDSSKRYDDSYPLYQSATIMRLNDQKGCQYDVIDNKANKHKVELYVYTHNGQIYVGSKVDSAAITFSGTDEFSNYGIDAYNVYTGASCPAYVYVGGNSNTSTTPTLVIATRKESSAERNRTIMTNDENFALECAGFLDKTKSDLYAQFSDTTAQYINITSNYDKIKNDKNAVAQFTSSLRTYTTLTQKYNSTLAEAIAHPCLKKGTDGYNDVATILDSNQKALEERETKLDELLKEVNENTNLTEDEKDEITGLIDEAQAEQKKALTQLNGMGDIIDEGDYNCTTLIDEELLKIISELWGIIQIVCPIIVLIFGGLDFGKAVMSEDKDALKKAGSTFMKRCIILVIIFLLPYLVRFALNIIGINGEICGID